MVDNPAVHLAKVEGEDVTKLISKEIAQFDAKKSMETLRNLQTRVSISSNGLRHQVAALLHEGNMHQVIIKQCDGPVLIEMPVTLGVIGTLLFVMLARLRWTAVVTTLALFFRLQIFVDPPIQ